MDKPQLNTVSVGTDSNSRNIAVKRRTGAVPGLVWLGGFKSDMSGSKAKAVDNWAAGRGLACTRFDYSGHGLSSGKFEDGTISLWLEEALFVIRNCTSGPLILIGSSMGGWIALLAALALWSTGEDDRLGGMVLIAPALDMTEELIWNRLDDEARADMVRTGSYNQPSEYSEDPYVLTMDLVVDGRNHLIGEEPIRTNCPVHILQGMLDSDVPWTHAAGLAERMAHDDAALTLIGDGDHRLSRPEDLDRLIHAINGLINRNPSAR